MPSPTIDLGDTRVAGPRMVQSPVLPGWIAVGTAFILLWQFGASLKWAFVYPKAWLIPAQAWISGAMTWLVNSASFGLSPLPI